MDQSTTKCVMVIDETLPLGIVANTAGILGVALGGIMPEINGVPIVDGGGNEHAGITELAIPILKGSRKIMMELREKLFSPEFEDVVSVDFSETAERSRSYAEYTAKMEILSGAEIRYIGIAMCGPKKKINRLTGGLPLLK